MKKKDRSRKTLAYLAGVGTALFVFALYVMTLAPTVLPYALPELADVAMLQMQVCTLSIPHPTGYPTYLMLSKLLTYLPFGDCGYGANLASAIYGAFAVLAVFAAGYLLSRRVLAASVGALAFGLGGTIWSQAVMAEVYTLNALLIGLIFAVLLRWRERRDEPSGDRYLLLAAFLGGLTLTNHLTSGLILPAALVFVALVEWRKLPRPMFLAKGVGLFVLGLTPYLYLPIRANTGAPMTANNPDNLERTLYVISGGDLTGSFFAFGLAELPARISFYLGYLFEDHNLPVLQLALLGLFVLISRDRPAAALLGIPFTGWFIYAIENNIVDIELYFIPTYLVICIWSAAGLGALLEWITPLLERLGERATLGKGALAVLLLALPLWGVWGTYERVDMSDDYRGRMGIEAVVENVPQNATVLHHRSNLWYMVLVEERRRDLTLVDPFQHNKDFPYNDIVWPADLSLPETDRRFGTDDLSGVKAARMALEKGPVYLFAQEEARPSNFVEAGFDVTQVEGPVYRIKE
ncbi:MAG: DUF2723 domain-containing protein [Rubrobacteraceae bacterium]